MMFADLKDWLKRNPPADMPFWPHAVTTGRVGLRELQMLMDIGASPIHTGVDRSGGADFTVPFDSHIFWKRLHKDAAWGSILRVKAVGIDLELQIAHTDCSDGEVLELDGFYKKGEKMPVVPGSLGISSGVHTHTEVVTPLDADLRRWMIDEGCESIIESDGDMAMDYVAHHCDCYSLDRSQMMEAIWRQIGSWGIIEATTMFVVRHRLPPYRTPAWGEGKTMHIDSQWLLKI